MIAICWQQLPIYAARAIGKFVEGTSEEVVVLRVVSARFDIKGAAEATHTKVYDVDRNDRRSLIEVVGELPDVIVTGGWASPCFTRWTREVRNAGGRTILVTDEPFIGKSFRQYIRMLRFKLVFNKLFDKIFVVGSGGVKQFQDWYGLDPKRIFTGAYGSDPSIFFNGPPLVNRPKRFLYVGHFDDNKNVMAMCEAFLAVHEQFPDWELEICGSGPLACKIGQTVGVENWTGRTVIVQGGLRLNGFVPTEKLGEKYRSARVLILGSFSEKWGVVVHEAAASGCLLLLSDAVGSRYDFAAEENAVVFNPHSRAEMEEGMRRLIGFDEKQLAIAQEESVSRARRFSPTVFATNLSNAILDLRR